MPTKIEWTQETWNPWVGCAKVSPGCKICYAERLVERGLYKWRSRNFGEVVRAPDHLFDAPLHWKNPRMVFPCSMSDFFHPDADDWRAEAWRIMNRTGRHTYQVLTKRPERLLHCLPAATWPHLWLGVSIESPQYLQRTKELTAVRASVHFLSLEPLLAPLPGLDLTDIEWVIVGGESGPGCRPMQPDWVCDIRDQCLAAGIPFFFKQWGGFPDKRGGEKAVLDRRVWHEFPQEETT